jgi:hypothetical protein
MTNKMTNDKLQMTNKMTNDKLQMASFTADHFAF